jgi:hypothetical protein
LKFVYFLKDGPNISFAIASRKYNDGSFGHCYLVTIPYIYKLFPFSCLARNGITRFLC